jgi:hypothetical protein
MPTHTPSERRKRKGESNLARARRAGRTAPGAGRTAAPKRKKGPSFLKDVLRLPLRTKAPGATRKQAPLRKTKSAYRKVEDRLNRQADEISKVLPGNIGPGPAGQKAARAHAKKLKGKARTVGKIAKRVIRKISPQGTATKRKSAKPSPRSQQRASAFQRGIRNRTR